jgi:transcriptional regulator with GAF, ATPase, and Fis domain
LQREWDQALEIINKRLENCITHLRSDLPINMVEQLKELKLDLILFALNENMKIGAKAARMLNMNRTTMVSMLQNELLPYIEKRKNEKINSREKSY